jgi:lipid-A-disaccharide synthase
MKSSFKVLFSAGESSGDKHAANLFLELKARLPNVTALGMGGKQMREAGIDIRFDSSSIAVIGLIEVIKHYRDIRFALQLMKQCVVEDKPDLLICVDYKEFNLKLAQFAKRQGVKVLFYVSPQVWAWRPGRVITYGKAIDMMAVIFPFEVSFYEAENIPVRYVGHPSVDKVNPLHSREHDYQAFGLTGKEPVIGLLPGSRHNEIRRMLPVMLEAAKQLKIKYPQAVFLLPQADSVPDEALNAMLAHWELPLQIIKHQPYDVIQCCDAVMTTSGTATLEVALLKVPMVIAYKLSPLTYWLGRLLVKTRFIGLPNIIAGQAIVKELIQQALTPDHLVDEMDRILNDVDYRQRMIEHLDSVRHKLGTGGGSKNMAELAQQMLTQ